MTNMDQESKLTITAIRAKLSAQSGRVYWRSLEELAETEEFTTFLHREFPREASLWDESVDRRSFLKVMAASLGLAGLNACSRPPEEKIVPYVRPPEDYALGSPKLYATSFVMGGFAQGVLVRSYEGRPVKVEGNRQHPASMGATSVFGEASLLSLYDPDRSQVVTNRGGISTWEKFLVDFRTETHNQLPAKGSGIRIITETVTSPALGNQMRSVLDRYPNAKWYQYDPINRDNTKEGSRLAFGEIVETHFHFDKADLIVSLGSDFLSQGPAHLRYTRDFTSKRRVLDSKKEMNRLYVVEATPTLTGAMADHRLPMGSRVLERFAFAMARELGVNVPTPSFSFDRATHRWMSALVADLKRHRGSSIIIAGDSEPPSVHALAHAMNALLGNYGRTVVYTSPVEYQPTIQMDSLRELVIDMEAGKVNLLLILGGNPMYDMPVDLNFGRAISKVDLRVRLGLYEDETSLLCHWHIPEAHWLESWGDVRAFNGTTSLQQPLIAPLYDGKSAHELLSIMLDQPERKDYHVVRDYWKTQHPEQFEEFWRRSLNDGFMADSALPPKLLNVKLGDLHPREYKSDSLEILFRPDPSVWDGRFANNGWLQELPRPLTTITWDNVAMVSPSLAERMQLANGDVIELAYCGVSVRAPVWIMPGQAENSVTVHLGYGRSLAGKVGNGLGFNAYALRTTQEMWSGVGLEIRKTGKHDKLATTQNHHTMENRAPIRKGTISQYVENPNFASEIIHPPAPEQTLYPEYVYEGYKWGMSIDLNACTGCNACVVACQAENNIPIVGKEQVARSREMHWIRIDRYFSGSLDNPEINFQPLACVHCENAPCEIVCPVNATVHDHEGLNVMVYNRCVGTRYCSNNCPYKVRRFNFLEYNGELTETQKMQKNPEVTVRSRGVMEKCTYCIQRISAARIEAKKEDRSIRDGEVITACQAACPAEAIVFGDLNDPASLISKRKSEPRIYGLLSELNTRPRTTYLAKLRNPNPDLEEIGRS